MQNCCSGSVSIFSLRDRNLQSSSRLIKIFVAQWTCSQSFLSHFSAMVHVKVQLNLLPPSPLSLSQWQTISSDFPLFSLSSICSLNDYRAQMIGLFSYYLLYASLIAERAAVQQQLPLFNLTEAVGVRVLVLLTDSLLVGKMQKSGLSELHRCPLSMKLYSISTPPPAITTNHFGHLIYQSTLTLWPLCLSRWWLCFHIRRLCILS